jgi:hypothetical protein
MRRRLAHGIGVPAEKHGWKPFGAHDYGYDELYQTVSSFTIWAAVTWGSFTIDPYEAAAILASAIYYSERKAKKPEAMVWGTGASWIHNVQAGYCWYHYYFKGRNEWPVFLGTWAEMAGDMGAVAQEKWAGHRMYSHKAHREGLSIGFGTALLLDKLRPKPGKKTSVLWKAIPLLAVGLLFMQPEQVQPDSETHDYEENTVGKEWLQSRAGREWRDGGDTF